MSLADTIAAIATGPGRSARAIVRLSGPGVGPALEEIIHSQPPRGASVAHLSLVDHRPNTPANHEPLADIPTLLIRSVAPDSYTGEDTAELLIPGNLTLAHRVLARVTSVTTASVRLAEPGEFTARAYLHGKLSIEQAEGVAATIAARTAEELHAAKDLLGGRVGRHHEAWADEAATLLALVESGVDFSDQEGVVTIAPGYIRTPMTATNRYRMPFLTDVDVFARKAVAAIEARRSFAVIPWQMGVVARGLRLLPNGVFDALFARAPRKARDPQGSA